VGHLRQQARPWYDHTAGERYNESNDGNMAVKDEDAES